MPIIFSWTVLPFLLPFLPIGGGAGFFTRIAEALLPSAIALAPASCLIKQVGIDFFAHLKNAKRFFYWDKL